MGLLGEIYSAGDSAKRKLKGLLSDPLGELGLLGARAAEDMQTFLDTGAKAYPMLDPRLKPRLDTPQGREMVVDQNVARRQFGDMAGNMGMAAATVWHGSPHKFDRFDSSKIGTGEGAQAYGHGLYLAESPAVAKGYQKRLGNADYWSDEAVNALLEKRGKFDEFIQKRYKLDDYFVPSEVFKFEPGRVPEKVRKANEILAAKEAEMRAAKDIGNLYKVDLPDEAIAKMLDWDKPVSEAMRKPLSEKAMREFGSGMTGTSGEHLYKEAVFNFKAAGHPNPAQAATDWLRAQGVPGIRYLDGGSRGAGTGTSNYVVFPGNEGLLTILERNGVAP